MSDIDEIQAKLAVFSQLREMATEQEAKLKVTKKQVESLREELMFDLQANRLESLKNDKLTVAIAHKPSVSVLDPLKVEKWLEANNFNVDEYKRLDMPMIKALAEGRYKDPEYGEVIDGVEIGTLDYLTIREKKQ